MYSVGVLFLIFAVVYVEQSTGTPQIFNEVYEFCDYDFDGKKLAIPNKIWSTSNSQLTIYFSLCKSAFLQKSCPMKTSSCIVFKETKAVIDLGQEFVPDKSGDFNLKLLNGNKCPSDPSRNYTVMINLHCSNIIKHPRLIIDDDCAYEINMMRPDCAPKCTGLVGGAYLLNLHDFPKNIKVTSDNRTFSLTLCGSTATCGSQDVSSCEILNNVPTPLVATQSQSFNYDVTKNELTARGRYKFSERRYREIEVLIKCSWKSKLSHVVYKKVPTKGRKYKFELESSYGCIKLPSDCFVKSQDNLKYNLSGLYRPTNPWSVSLPHGKILLNICGPLQFDFGIPENECSRQYSQICEIQQNGNRFVNKGSILSRLEVNEYGVKAMFTSGSVCKENSSKAYGTEIQFECSGYEQGPVFQKYEKCVTYLGWKTTNACPVDSYRGKNCLVSNAVGNWNVQNLYSTVDKAHPLAPNVGLVYNLCGPLHSSCSGYSNVSFCLKTGQKEQVIGWENSDILSENKILKLQIDGALCSNKKYFAKVDVIFVCSYENPPPQPTVDILQDNCQFNMIVSTPHACLSENTFHNCTYDSNTAYYDLSPLTSRSSNYVIADRSENNIEYTLNVCGPIISGPETQCRGQSMVCRRDKNELNVKRQFISLGGVSQPKISNNNLIIEAPMGTLCEDFRHYRSLIVFECAARQETPKLLKKEPCLYTFIWRTPHGCPKNKTECVVSNSNSRLSKLINQLQQKRFKIIIDETKFTFNFCEDTYEKCTNKNSNTSCQYKTLSRELIDKEDKSIFQFDLKENCESGGFGRIDLEIICGTISYNESFKEISRRNCVLTLALKTQLACFGNVKENKTNVLYTTTKTILKNDIRLNTNFDNMNHKNQTITSMNNSKAISYCSITNQYTNYRLHLTEIQSSKIRFGLKTYQVNIKGDLPSCSGIFCINDVVIVPFSNSCPKIVYDYTNSDIQLQFLSEATCERESSLRLSLKCGKGNKVEEEPKIQDDNLCHVIIEYSLHQACNLLEKESSYISTSAIIGGTTGGVFLFFGIVVVALALRKKIYFLSQFPIRKYFIRKPKKFCSCVHEGCHLLNIEL